MPSSQKIFNLFKEIFRYTYSATFRTTYVACCLILSILDYCNGVIVMIHRLWSRACAEQRRPNFVTNSETNPCRAVAVQAPVAAYAAGHQNIRRQYWVLKNVTVRPQRRMSAVSLQTAWTERERTLSSRPLIITYYDHFTEVGGYH